MSDTYDGSTPLDNDRHERFCHEYLKDLEAGRAYERAGYKARGSVANAAASRLLADVNSDNGVPQRIAHLKSERSERTEITLDMVIAGLHTEATKTTNPAGARVQAWGLLGKHVGAFEADNKQRTPEPVRVIVESVGPRTTGEVPEAQQSDGG